MKEYEIRLLSCFVDRANAAVQNFVWVKDAPVSLTEGPEGTVYCRVEDPTGNVVFDGLGRCAIRIDRVSMEHDGTWQMTIGTPGRILTEKHPFTVTVKEAGWFHWLLCYIHSKIITKISFTLFLPTNTIANQ